MTPLLTSLIAFAVIFGGTFLGMFVRYRLPEAAARLECLLATSSAPCRRATDVSGGLQKRMMVEALALGQ